MTDNRHIHPAAKERIARDHAKAVKAAEEAVDSARASYGEEHPQVAVALTALGDLHHSHSAFAQAETAFTQALVIREKAPADASELADALRDLARVYDALDERERARALMQRAARVESEAFQSDMWPVKAAKPESSAHADFVEEMAGSWSNTFWTQILGGLLLPVLLGWRSLSIVIDGRVGIRAGGMYGSFFDDPPIVTGATARMFGVAWLCAALFAHFCFFWRHRNRTLCAYGKAVSMIGGVVILWWALIRLPSG